MRILVAGCGYLGSCFTEARTREDHEVFGIRREEGIDLLKPETLEGLGPCDLAVFSQAPGPADHYFETYYKGTANLLAVLERRMPARVVFVSSTGVYGSDDASWVDEAADPDPPNENARALLETERLVLDSRIPGVIVRLGGLYGPGRNRLAALKEGRIKPVFSRQYANRVRVEDAADAIWLLAKKGRQREVYIATDDRPATEEEFYRWLCPRLGMPVPGLLPAGPESGKRCSNAKIKRLGFQPKYHDYVAGYEDLLHGSLGPAVR